MRTRKTLAAAVALGLATVGLAAPSTAHAAGSAEVTAMPASVFLSNPAGTENDTVSVTASYTCVNDTEAGRSWGLYGSLTRSGMTPFYYGIRYVSYQSAKCTGQTVTEVMTFKRMPQDWQNPGTYLGGPAELAFGLYEMQGAPEAGTGNDVHRTATTSVVLPHTPPPPAPVIQKPSAPRSVTATRARTSVKITWRGPASDGGSAVTGYQAYRPTHAKSLSASARSYTFTGLKPLTAYNLYVRAQNKAGYGPWASIKVTTTAPARKAYKKCTALNKVYLHGVGKKGARDKTSGKRVTNFHVDTKLYKMNDGRVQSKKQYDLDRDNDGIACEKR